MTPDDPSASAVHERLAAPLAEEDASRPRPGSFDSPDERADFWRQQFEQERERLAKLWIAYQDIKAELEDRQRQAETIAAEKVGEELATDPGEETADVPDTDEREVTDDQTEEIAKTDRPRHGEDTPDEAGEETVEGSSGAEEPTMAVEDDGDETIETDGAQTRGDG